MGLKRIAAVIKKDCVACGCCEKVCPKEAIQVAHGVFAVVDREHCVGCGKCEAACPASVIEMEERK